MRTDPFQYESPANVSLDLQRIYIADTGNNRIQKVDSKTLNPVLAISTPFNFNQPTGVSVASDPIVERIYIADTGNNRVLVIGIPKADPLAAWNAAKAKLINGDVEGALMQFSTTTIHDYRSLFNFWPNTLSQNMNAVGSLTPIYTDDDEARYYFTTTINTQSFTFIITFANEFGSWKIRNF